MDDYRLFTVSLVFFYLSKLLFSGFLQFKGNFARGKKASTELLDSPFYG